MSNILGFAGFSGSGKTTLLEKLTPLLVARGLRVAVVKHDTMILILTSRARTATASARRARAKC